MTNLTVPAAFQEKLRDAMFDKFMELFPKEQLEIAIDSEIKAFFETEIAPFTKTTVKVANPNYRSSWDSRDIDVPALASSLKITPFRQLIWESMHEHLKPIVDEVIADRNSKFGESFAEYISQAIKPAVETTLNANMHTLGAAVSSTLLAGTMQSSVQASHASLTAALRMMNVPDSVMNSIPVFSPSLPLSVLGATSR